MTEKILLAVDDVLDRMESNQNTLRILADMGQELCTNWNDRDTPEEARRMVERLHVVFSSMHIQIKEYDGMMVEGMRLVRREA